MGLDDYCHLACYVILDKFVRRLNGWYYEEICTPELARRVLSDDDNFRPSYPTSFPNLQPTILSEVSSTEEQMRFRRLVTLPIVGYNVLANSNVHRTHREIYDQFAQQESPR